MTTKSLCPDWEPGVRAALNWSKTCCPVGISASYAFIEMNTTSKLIGNQISLTTIHPYYALDNSGQAKASWRSCYHEWDLLLTYEIACHQCNRFIPFCGVSGIYLEQQFTTILQNIVTTGFYGPDDGIGNRWDSHFWGVGLRAGVEYEHQISNCISFFTKVQGSILAGNAHLENKELLNNEAVAAFEDDIGCWMIDGYQMRTGFVYTTNICQCDVAIRLGYEFLRWHNLPNIPTYANVGLGDTFERRASSIYQGTSSSIRAFGFHGLFTGLVISF